MMLNLYTLTSQKKFCLVLNYYGKDFVLRKVKGSFWEIPSSKTTFHIRKGNGRLWKYNTLKVERSE